MPDKTKHCACGVENATLCWTFELRKQAQTIDVNFQKTIAVTFGNHTVLFPMGRGVGVIETTSSLIEEYGFSIGKSITTGIIFKVTPDDERQVFLICEAHLGCNELRRKMHSSESRTGFGTGFRSPMWCFHRVCIMDNTGMG